MLDLLEELLEKWDDVITHSDDFTEQALAQEFIDDLKALRSTVHG